MITSFDILGSSVDLSLKIIVRFLAVFAFDSCATTRFNDAGCLAVTIGLSLLHPYEVVFLLCR